MKTIRIPLGKTIPFQILPKPKNEPTEQIERIGVSAKRAAEMIDVCERTIWNLAKEGKIRAIRIGKRVIISVQSLREFVDGATKTALDLELGESPYKRQYLTIHNETLHNLTTTRNPFSVGNVSDREQIA